MYVLVAIGIIVISLAVRAGLVWYSVDRYQNYWNNLAQAEKKPNSITLIALGDSLAQGVGATSTKYSYVGRLETAIAEKTSQPVYVINLSKSGAKIRDVINDQIPKLKDINMNKKTVVTLDIGTNDVTRGSYGDQFKADIEKLFSQLPQKTVVADLPYLGKSRWQSKDPQIEQANIILHEAAQKYGLTVVPVHQNLKDKNSLNVYSGDLFHPSNYGYEIWFETFWTTLQKRLN